MCAICGLDEILFVFVITKTLKQIHVLSVSFFAVQRNECLERKIEQLAKGVTHESMDVCQVALSKLRSLLHNNQTELHKLIVMEERVHPVIANLINMIQLMLNMKQS